MMCGEASGIYLMGRDQTQQHWRRIRIHQTGRDGDILRPQIFEMKRGRLTVHADVGHVAPGAYQFGTQLETRRDPDSLDGDVDAKAVGELVDEREQGRRARC